jgi:uncharacterized protein YfaA (DUF2138 family)
MSSLSFTQRYLLALLSLIGIALLGAYMLGLPPFLREGGAFAPALARPDALIRTYSLAKLPRDLLRIPLAREVLTEEFAAYCEWHENRLALTGTVRRIAYEHGSNLSGNLVEASLEEPAEVALWAGADGRLRYFVVAMSDSTLARAVQVTLPVILKHPDSQLSRMGKLDGTDVDIVALEYGPDRHLLVLAKGTRVVMLSHPEMLFVGDDRDGNAPRRQSKSAVELLRELLRVRMVSVFSHHFLREEPLPEKHHEIILGTRAFAFGYETFVPGLEAVALTFDDEGAWRSAALFDGPPPEGRALWPVLPQKAGLCAILPVDWTRMAQLMHRFNARLEQPAVPPWFIDQFVGPAAVCWYREARPHAPLIAVRLKTTADDKRAREFFALADAVLGVDRSETVIDSEHGLAMWRGKWAPRDGERLPDPALSIVRDTVFFSPDAALVERAREVVAGRHPAIADHFGNAGADKVAFVDPGALAAIVRAETAAVLPGGQDEAFRAAARAYLAPRLKALARYPAQGIAWAEVPAPARRAWWPLAWETRAAGR